MHWLPKQMTFLKGDVQKRKTTVNLIQMAQKKLNKPEN